MSTPNYGLPFPTLGDVPDGPGAIQALATATDSAINGEMVSTGLDGMTVRTGTAQTGANGDYTLAFPAGTFTGPPRVLVQPIEVTSAYPLIAGGATATSTVVRIKRTTTGEGMANVYFYWIAIGTKGAS